MELYTVKTDGSVEMVVEKSRFICYLKRVQSKEQAYEYIKELKKTHWDATHNCSAFIIGEQGMIQGSSDDGEPSGTAGIPMLEVLKKKKLHDVVAVVTRYFGGVKLGAGGLVRAYSKSVSNALEQIGIVQKIEVGEYILALDIVSAGKALNILYQQSLFQVASVDYQDVAKIYLRFRQADLQQVVAELTELLQMSVELELVDTSYIEEDV